MKELVSYHDLLAAGDRVYENDGGVITKAAPGGTAAIGIAVLMHVSAHMQRKEAPPPPPATWDAYARKSSGVTAIIDLLVKDLGTELSAPSE